MRNLLCQIETGLEMNLYYLSLMASLSIPDICGALGSENGIASGEKYAPWFDSYVGEKYSQFFSGEDCYRFRCSLLHQGSSQPHHRNTRYSRILFIEPTATTIVSHRNIIDDALNIDVRLFCLDIIAGARLWLNEVERTEHFRENYDRFMRRYPSGLSPYITGVPVIG